MKDPTRISSVAAVLLLAIGCDLEAVPASESAYTDTDTATATATDSEAETETGTQAEEPDAGRPGADAIRPPADPVAAAEDCCAAGGTGCSDVVVESCVCDADPYCCNNTWDSICVGEVASLGCGTCESEVACCSASGDPGCGNDDAQSCVCDADPYCCDVAWDSLCVSEVESLGCGSCGPVDLVISELTTPAQACLGEDIASGTSLTVTNDGVDPVSPTVGIAWYLSSDTTVGPGDRLLAGGRDQITGGMGAGASASVGLGVNQIPASHTAGSQYLLTVIDEFDAVAERDEGNNVMASPIDITATCASPGDWFTGWGGTSFDTVSEGAAIATDALGNVYVVGSTYGPTIDLGEGPQTVQDADAFVVSYDALGNYRWSRLLAGPDYENARGVAVDENDNVFVSLESEGTLNVGSGATSPIGVRDLVVASFDMDGAPQWTQRYGASGMLVGGRDLAANAAGEIVAVGGLIGSASINFGGGSLAAGGAQDAFILGLDAAGAHRFSRRLASSGDDNLFGVHVDDAGNAVLAGGFVGTADYGGGPMTSGAGLDGLVMKLGPTGSTLWTEHYGDSTNVFAEEVVVDASGNAYVTGTFQGSVTVGGVSRTASGVSDALLVAYDSSGSLLWSRQDGSSGLDYARGITIDDAGNLVTAGSFFGTSASYADRTITGAGNYDLVLAGIRATDGVGLWAQARGTTGTEEGYDVVMTAAGNLVVTGHHAGTWTEAGTTLSSAGERDIFVLSVSP